MNFEDSVEKVREISEERNFTQSVDLVINLQNIDLNDPENRFSENVKLPHRADEDVKVCVIGETIINNAENADLILDPDGLDEVIEDEDRAKEMAEEYDFFIAEAPLMPKIGKELGTVLGPRGKMPEPMQPGESPSERIERLRSTIPVSLKESPSIKCKVGNEEMDDDDISDNAEAVFNTVLERMPQRDHNVKDVLIKLTMGPPVEVNS